VTLPTDERGNLAILFTDVVGSTRGWEEQFDQMSASLALHDQIVRGVLQIYAGQVFSVAGDSFGVIFTEVDDCLAAAHEIDKRLNASDWPSGLPIAVRMSANTGPVIQRDGGCYGPEIVRTAILCEIGHAGQLLLTQEIVEHLDSQASRYLGLYRLRKISQPQAVSQFGHREFAPLRNVEQRVNTLPRPRTDILGREDLLRSLQQDLGDTRLLTLTGPGGVGKTRLGIELAQRHFDRAADSAHMIDLAAIHKPADLPHAFAQGINLTLLPDRDAVDQVAACLAARSCVLLLDNCEHLLDACAEITDRLLDHCTGLTIIATSRAALELEGERVCRVPVLPSGDDSAAVELFIRKAASQSAVPIDISANRHLVADICARLDGLPLAIELAAARTRSLPIIELHRKLQSRLDALTPRRAGRAGGARTLADVVAWSFELLSPQEQQGLKSLVVFQGGFSLPDVAPVLAISEAEADELLDALIAWSLLETHTTESGELRFRMLFSIAQFAGDQLASDPDAAALRDRHLAHFRALAERGSHPFIPHPALAHRHLHEQLNLRAAAEWAIESDRPADAARIAAGTVIAMDSAGEHQRGMRWSRAVAGRDDETAFNALVTEAYLFGIEGDLESQSRSASQAVELCASRPFNLLPVALCLKALHYMTFDPDQARQIIKQSLASAATSATPEINTMFCAMHLSWLDILCERTAEVLKYAGPFPGSMAVLTRVLAHLMKGEFNHAQAELTAAERQPADEWHHFLAIARCQVQLAGEQLREAAEGLTDAAAADTGLRRWQDGDFLISFATLHEFQGNRERALQIVDSCRSRHALTQGIALRLKQRLHGWPQRYESPESLEWLQQVYARGSAEHYANAQPALLQQEIEHWRDWLAQRDQRVNQSGC
jgi:predicted ATPase/class 3 adenylate cyclase